MTTRFFLGIDIGTTSLKAGLWREDGVQVAAGSYDYAVRRPHPTWADMNPRDWWDAVCAVTPALIGDSGVDPAAVAGVGVDGLGWSPVPVDDAGEPLYRSLIWLDRRAEPQAQALQQSPHADELVNLAANPLDAAYITPKLVWLREHEPEVYRQTAYWLSSSSYVVKQLTGVDSCDFTQAYGWHCFDIRNERWDEQAADWLGIDLAQLPPLHQSCAVVGTVTAHAAAATGLKAGTPVIAGALDAAAGAFSAGVARVGQTADQGGTAFGMSICTDRVVVEPRLIFSHHVVPGTYILQGGTVGGAMFPWFRDTFGQAERVAAEVVGGDAYSLMTAQAQGSVPGANGVVFLPYMSGERSPLWNSNARGVFFGLSYATTRADLIRAIMEGCVFAVHHNTHVAEETGVRVKEWIGIGGASNSAAWCQLKADVSGRPFTVARQANGEPGDYSLGLAVMCGFATGVYDDLAATMERFLPQRHQYTPAADRHARYSDLFGFYLHLSETLQPEFERLAALSSASP